MIINKRKNFTDFIGLFFAIAMIFGIAIFFIILSNAYSDNIKPQFESAITTSTPVDSNANVSKILDQTDNGIGRFNVLFPFLLVGIFGFVMVTALFARSHPAFFFIGLIILGVSLILAAIFSNVYENLTDQPEYSNAADTFNIQGLFLNNLPIMILILFAAIALILYAFPAKPTGGGYV